MVQRYRVTADRIILTKPGFDARDSLSDNQKLFDSNWNFAGAIIAAGNVYLAAWPASNVLVIPFDPPGYVPAAVVTYTVDLSGELGFTDVGFPGFIAESSRGFADGSRVYGNRIEVVRNPPLSGMFRFPMTVRYTVFGV